MLKNYMFTLRCKGEDPEIVRIPVRAESSEGALEALGVFFLTVAVQTMDGAFDDNVVKINEDRKSLTIHDEDGEEKQVIIEDIKEFSFLK